MKRSLRSINFILMFVLCFGALGFTPRAVEAAPGALRISQVYGAGGNSGAVLTHDFIEIFNSSNASVSLSGLSLQYASATGTGNFGESGTQLTELPSVMLQPGQYYLVQEAGGSNGSPIPTPDLVDATPISMGATGGKVALVTGQTTLGCNGSSTLCSEAQLSRIIDLVGFGNANFFEGSGPTPAPSTTLSVFRAGGGCVDTDNNAADFTAAAPAPRNTDSTTNSCTPPDPAPTVSSTIPVDGAVKVALDSSITITFSEAVTMAADWYEIDCSISGLHTATVDETADPLIVLDPASDFVLGDVCEVTVFAAKVTDDDTVDPPDTMAANYTFTFSVLKAPKINEYSQSTAGTDVEYVEIYGDPSTDYSAYKVLEIEGDWSTSNTYEGQIEEIIDIGTTDVNGLYLASLPANALENSSTSTLLLVKSFSGVLNQDLDTDDNGALDVTPWDSIVDSVAYHDGGTSDLTYGIPVLGVAYDDLLYTPGGASRIPDGFDSESATDWVRNDFDLAGIPGNPGTIGPGEAYNTPSAVVSTVPVDLANDVYPNASIAITFNEPVTVTGSWFSISCSSSGVHTAVVTDTDPTFTLDPDTDFSVPDTCTVTVFAANVNDDDTDDASHDYMVSDYVFSFSTVEIPEVCGDPFTPIYDIQGSGATTPLPTNVELSTEGVVVGDFQTNAYVSGTKNGFYIQAITGDGNPATSDGVFVYSYLVDVQAGDHVRVTGKPAEYTTGSSSLTQITSVTNILTCSTGNTITPTTLSLPVAADFDYEDYEGMLVTYEQALVISEYFEFDR